MFFSVVVGVLRRVERQGVFMGPDARSAVTPSMVGGAGSEFATPVVGDGSDGGFWVALSRGQVQELVQQEVASRGGGYGLLGVVLVLSGGGERLDMEELTRDQAYHDRRVSQSVIRSLLVLGAFVSGEGHGVNSLSKKLGLGTTTTWRYLKTWVALGVLEELEDRRYQLARRWRGHLSEPAKSRTRRPAR